MVIELSWRTGGWQGRAPPSPSVLVSFGLLAVLALPCSATAWGLGRSVRRKSGAAGNGQATAGVVLGIVGTALSVILLGGCAAIFL